MKWKLREATAADLEPCAGIMVRALNDLKTRVGQPASFSVERSWQPAWWEHLLATTAGFWVAEGPEGLVGFTNSLRREDEWFLSHLFIEPAAQSQGIGKALFRKSWEAGATAKVHSVVADSANPVSVSLYSRSGMTPLVPLLSLSRRLEGQITWPAVPTTVLLEPVEVGDIGWLVPFDRTIRGHARPLDHGYFQGAGFQLHRCIAQQTTVGYLYTTPWGVIGPGVAGPRSLSGAVAAALHQLQGAGCTAASIYVPGPANSLLSWLLQAGFRHQSIDLYCADSLPGDWRCYVPFRAGLP